MSERTNQAVDRLAAALHELSYQGRITITPDARMLLCPGNPQPEDAGHLHAVGLSVELVELLADTIERLIADRDLFVAALAVARNGLIGNAVDDAFAELDLNEITKAVLDETAPQDRMTVTRALDDLFGDHPTGDDTEAED